MAIEILKPGPQTTVQDGGRPGNLAHGIPPAGAQDAFSLAMGNLLLRNAPTPPPLTLGDPGAAGLEMLLAGPAIRFEDDAVIALTGAGCDARIGDAAVPMWEAVPVAAGDVLECGRLGPGLRGYLSVAGGLDVEPYLGSRATYVRGRQGGLNGRALQKGDRIEVGAPARALDEVAGRRVRDEARPSLSPPWTLRVVPGPQDDLFAEEAVDLFFSAEWRLSPTSDRMGFRFKGPRLALRDRPDYLVRDAGAGPADIVDDVIPVGGIQVAGGVEPIVMGVENPSVGGYAKIGTVISADLGTLGQVRPEEAVRFEPVELAAALTYGSELTDLVGEDAITAR
ncbi:MAG: biotin-dependent carboxyltransferase family protein [Thermoleophilaceae bacterium]